MFNVGGGEFLVIMLVALIVLGPAKLPEAAKQIGAMARELRRISSSFQQELKSALDEPVEEQARVRGRNIVSSEQQPAPATDDIETDENDGDSELAPFPEPQETLEDDVTPDEPAEPISTAEAAGMYDLVNDDESDREAGSP